LYLILKKTYQVLSATKHIFVEAYGYFSYVTHQGIEPWTYWLRVSFPPVHSVSQLTYCAWLTQKSANFVYTEHIVHAVLWWLHQGCTRKGGSSIIVNNSIIFFSRLERWQ